MLDNILINHRSEQGLTDYLKNPSQNVVLIGNKWLNNGQIAKYLAKEMLGIDNSKLSSHPYLLQISALGAKSIGIDVIRQINNFIRLKVPVQTATNRVIIIEDAEKLTLEAQNALLKSLEEPPVGTIFILSAETVSDLLPTIISRLRLIRLKKPPKDEVVKYFEVLSFDKSEIEQVYLISNGLPELMQLMLSDPDHGLNKAAVRARQLLSGSTLDRLNAVNDLAKDKQAYTDLVFIIKQMSKIGINSKDATSASRWRKILGACLDSELKMKSNAQTKLVITNFVLSIA